MNKLLNLDFGANSKDVAVLLLRIGLAGMMLVHGIPKMQMLFSGEAIQFPGVMGLDPTSSLALAVFAEVVASILILVGLVTRPATVPLIITMLVAVFLIHGEDPFAKQELGLHYLLGYILLFLLGAGRYSLDHELLKMNRKNLPQVS